MLVRKICSLLLFFPLLSSTCMQLMWFWHKGMSTATVMSQKIFLKSKFFQHFPLLKTTFSNICTCMLLILLSQRIIPMSCLIASKNSFWKSLNPLFSFGYWTAQKLLPSERTDGRGKCYHVHHFFDTTFCWSLTISNILRRFLTEASSSFPSVTPVRLADAWYWNWNI